MHIHGGKFQLFYENTNYLVQRMIKYCLKKSDLIIVTSDAWVNIIRDIINIGSTDIRVAPNGFNKQIFKLMPQEEARLKLNLPLDKKIILTVGHLEKVKGHEFLLRALDQVFFTRKDLLVCIIGDGPLKDDLKQIAFHSTFKENICFLGSLPVSEIPFWMNASDIFVLPSLHEGNPTVMFESLGVGLPFVGSSVGGIPDIISDSYGILCYPGDVNDLANKIMIALDKSWDRKIISQYGKKYGWDIISELMSNIYRELDER